MLVNNLDVPTALLPGNFGARVIDNMMPTNLSDVHRDRRSTQVQNFVCEGRVWEVPRALEAPLEVDYLTDDESDDGQEFEVPVPELDELISGFEAGDDQILKDTETFAQHLVDLKARGFEKETREINRKKRIRIYLLEIVLKQILTKILRIKILSVTSS